MSLESRLIQSSELVQTHRNSLNFTIKEDVAQLASRVLSDKVAERIYTNKEDFPIIIDGFDYNNKTLYSVLSQLNNRKPNLPTISMFKENLKEAGIYVSLKEGGKYSQTYSLVFDNKSTKKAKDITLILAIFFTIFIGISFFPNYNPMYYLQGTPKDLSLATISVLFIIFAFLVIRSFFPYKNKFVEPNFEIDYKNYIYFEKEKTNKEVSEEIIETSKSNDIKE